MGELEGGGENVHNFIPFCVLPIVLASDQYLHGRGVVGIRKDLNFKWTTLCFDLQHQTECAPAVLFHLRPSVVGMSRKLTSFDVNQGTWGAAI